MNYGECLCDMCIFKEGKRQMFQKAYEEIIEIRMKIDSSETALYRKL